MPTRLKSQQAFQSNGWERLPGTLTYASDTTINTSVDLTGVIQKGDKLLMTNSGVKYNYVVAITSSLITVAGNGVANAAITAPFFSKIATPQGFPLYFSFTPVVTCPSGTPPTYANTTARFSITNGLVSMSMLFENTSGGTAGASANPIYLTGFPCSLVNAGVMGVGVFYEQDIATIKTIFARYASATSCYMHGVDGINIMGSDQSSPQRYLFFNITAHLA